MDRHRGHGSEPDQPDQPGGPDENGGCAAFGPLLEAYHHHALPSAQAHSVAEHTTGCAHCRAALADLAATARLIAAAPIAQPGPELRRRLMARIAAASMPFERDTVVNDVNDTNDTNETHDAPWMRPDTPPRRPGKGIQRLRVLLGTAAAVLIVALLAATLVMKTHDTPNQTNNGHSGSPASSAGCAPDQITTHLPARSFLNDLAMISPKEGWAVGSVLDASSGPANVLIAHYQNCAWTPIAMDDPGMTLMSVSMTSASDGWAVGGSSDGKPLALHYTGGAWQPVALPGEDRRDGVYDLVRMRSADEGWIALMRSKDQQGLLSQSLFHLANGRWSPVNPPFAMINDILPVGPNDAWIAGYVSDGQQSPVLYHYQAGKWTSVTLPHGVAVDQLRMTSPNDIWASGHISAPSNDDSVQQAAVLRYDGSGWRQISITASGHPQFVQAFDSATSWAFTLSSSFNADDSISGAQYQHGGSWQTIAWPFKDTGLGFVSLGMNPIQRVAPDEYWTIGWNNGARQPNTNGGTASASVTVLLYFANGAWHEYGQ